MRFFMVASPGGSGTKWFANCINSASEDLNCYHGGMSELPDTWSRAPDETDPQKQLILAVKYTADRLGVFCGNVHGLYSCELKDFVIENGGSIFYLIKHPLDRCFSKVRHQLQLYNEPTLAIRGFSSQKFSRAYVTLSQEEFSKFTCVSDFLRNAGLLENLKHAVFLDKKSYDSFDGFSIQNPDIELKIEYRSIVNLDIRTFIMLHMFIPIFID